MSKEIVDTLMLIQRILSDMHEDGRAHDDDLKHLTTMVDKLAEGNWVRTRIESRTQFQRLINRWPEREFKRDAKFSEEYMQQPVVTGLDMASGPDRTVLTCPFCKWPNEIEAGVPKECQCCHATIEVE